MHVRQHLSFQNLCPIIFTRFNKICSVQINFENRTYNPEYSKEQKMEIKCIYYHDIVSQQIHHRVRDPAPVVSEPKGPLELVPCVQQQRVWMFPSEGLNLCPHPSRSPKTALTGGALPPILVHLLNSRVDIVGVENGQFEPMARQGNGQDCDIA